MYFTPHVHLNLPVNNSTQNLWYSVNYRIHNIITYFKIWLWEETSEVVEKRNRLNIIDFFYRGLYFLFWGKRFLLISGKSEKLEKLDITKQLFSFIQTFYPKILLLSKYSAKHKKEFFKKGGGGGHTIFLENRHPCLETGRILRLMKWSLPWGKQGSNQYILTPFPPPMRGARWGEEFSPGKKIQEKREKKEKRKKKETKK